MKFVETHLTKHHLFHAPHRWFFALLLSPIHAAEMHYKNRYHLTYGHAKMLFTFDLSLLGSIILLIVGTIFWFTYDPTVTENVTLTLTPTVHDETQPNDRIRSGEHVEYTITYANKSPVTLQEPTLAIRFPNTFIFLDSDPVDSFNRITNSFALPSLPPGANGTVQITGLFWGTPDQETHVSARLSYRQDKRSTREEKIITLITTPRDSVIRAILLAPEAVVDGSTIETNLTVTNDSHHTVQNIRLRFPAELGVDLKDMTVSTGSSTDLVWNIPKLEAHETATSKVRLTLRGNGKTSLPIIIQPEIIFPGINIPLLKPTRAIVNLVYPKIEARAVWADETPLRPGDTKNISFTLKNTGAVDLTDVSALLVFPESIVEKKSFTIDAKAHPELRVFPKDKEVSFTFPIKIKSFINTGADIVLAPQIKIHGLSFAGSYENTVSGSGVKVGTSLTLHSALRYYTNEGDQLGRGPLPPTVDKETKYGAFFYISNGTSLVDKVRFTAKLAPGFIYTGKKSLSHGQDVIYNKTTQTITWNFAGLDAHETGSLYIELAFTPTADQSGTTPVAVESIRVSAEDGFIGGEVRSTSGAVDIGLKEDALGRAKGTAVK